MLFLTAVNTKRLCEDGFVVNYLLIICLIFHDAHGICALRLATILPLRLRSLFLDPDTTSYIFLFR